MAGGAYRGSPRRTSRSASRSPTSRARRASWHRTIYGGQKTNKYLLETTGCGAAALDYDDDGWLDIFLVNGTTLEGFPKGEEPTQSPVSEQG